MATKAQLVTDVLGNLGVIEATETPSAEDAATVSARVVPTLAKYAALGIEMSGDAADLSNIPDAVYLSFVALVAKECLTPFLISGEKRQEIMQDAAQADHDLRRIYRQAFNPRRLRVPHFWGRRWPYGGSYNPTTGQ